MTIDCATTPLELTSSMGKAFAGGTFQCRNTSPNGLWECEGSDVGGVRRRRAGSSRWQCLGTAGGDAGRKVAGVVILDDGRIFSLVGNSPKAGKLLEYTADGVAKVIATGLHVRANSTTPGDRFKRTRPVGWTLHFDPSANSLYACTGDGLYVHDRDDSRRSGIIALKGEALRGFVHHDASTVDEVTDLSVCTTTRGLVRVEDVQGEPSETRLGTPKRAEDGAFTPMGNIVAACHSEGLFRIDSANGSTTNITPAQVKQRGNTGANGGKVLWSAVDCHPASGILVVTMINPVDGPGWVYRSTVPADTASSNDWEAIVHKPIDLLPGVGYVQPKNRTPGGAARGGKGLTGGQHVSFVRDDPSGGTVKTLNTLTTGLSRNAMHPKATAVSWTSDVEDSSLLSMVDIAVADNGVIGIAVADHNTMFANNVIEATSHEPRRIGVPNIGDAAAISVVGNTWVLAAMEDGNWQSEHNGWYSYTGDGRPDGWSSAGWDRYDWNRAPDFPRGLAPLPGVPPRSVSVCGHTSTGGRIRFHGMADGIGMVYQDYTPATGIWSSPGISGGGPVSEAETVSKNSNTTRSSVCSSDGTVVLHQMQSTGHVYRSLDRGETVKRIADGANGPEIAARPRYRTGYMRLLESADLAVVSNRNGLFLVREVSAATPKVQQLSDRATGPVAIDSRSGAVFVHMNTEGPAKLLKFDDIAASTSLNSARNIASTHYAIHLGDQANQLETTWHQGKLYLITLYQGGGFLVSCVPT